MSLVRADRALSTDFAVDVLSEDGSRYTVVRWAATQAWSCNCLGWVLHKAKKYADHRWSGDKGPHCRHVIMVVLNLAYLRVGELFRISPSSRKKGYTLAVTKFVDREFPRLIRPEPMPAPKPATRAIARRGEEV